MKPTKHLVLSIVCFLSLQSAYAQSAETGKTEYTFKPIQVHNYTWGYDIYVNNKLKIHQPNIPGKSGKEGFKTKEDAEKVARLVIEKMKRGEMPPTVTPEEISNLNIKDQ